MLGDESCEGCLDSRNKLPGATNPQKRSFPLSVDLEESEASPTLFDSDIEAIEDINGTRTIDCTKLIANPTSSKINKLMETLTEIRKQSSSSDLKKTIVFSQFTSYLTIIQALLLKKKVNCYHYTGAMAIGERTQCIDQFNKDTDHVVLLMSLKAGCVGLNLTSASWYYMLLLFLLTVLIFLLVLYSRTCGGTQRLKIKLWIG